MSFHPENICILGASGAIGNALTSLLLTKYPKANLLAFSQNGSNPIDYSNEDSIAEAAEIAAKTQPIDLVFVANGMLHNGNIIPEKSLRDLSAEKFHHIFEVNAVIPALIGKYFIPKLSRTNPSIFAALSGRVGSISDNHLGGWYSYRASKAALNMIIKNAAIETARQNNHAIIVALHPGTVDSNLSKPFQANMDPGKIFTPQYSAQKLLTVIKNLAPRDSGKHFAWNGIEINP